jgi:hypothetical protein
MELIQPLIRKNFELSMVLTKVTVEMGGAEEKSLADPHKRTQPFAPLTTKSVSRLDILLLLAIGVTAHDFASYYGFHINGVHAFYFSIPMIGVILSIKFERRIRKWWKSHQLTYE